MRYAKSLAQVVVTVLVAVLPLLAGDNVMGAVQWINVILIALGALAVFAAPNVPGAPVTKMVLSLLTAAAVVLHDIVAANGGLLVFGAADWVQVAVAVLGAAGVYAVPNAGPANELDNA